MKAKKIIWSLLAIAVVTSLSAVYVFSQGETSARHRTSADAPQNVSDFTNLSAEESLEAAIEFYRSHFETFDPAEGEITSFQELEKYLESIAKSKAICEEDGTWSIILVEP